MERLAFQCEFKADGAQPGTFSGYGSVFGNVDSYGDVVAKGAFRETLREWKTKGRTPPMLLQHGGGMFGGTASDLVPIGKWTAMSEDEHGLAVEGRLIGLDTERGKQIYAAMREGVMDGLSIGFRTKDFSLGSKPGDPARTLKKVDLVELSVVTMPANEAARVDGVKASEWTEREFETWLREAAGLSREEAKTIVSKGFRALLRDARQTSKHLDELARAATAARAVLTGAGHVGSGAGDSRRT